MCTPGKKSSILLIPTLIEIKKLILTDLERFQSYDIDINLESDENLSGFKSELNMSVVFRNCPFNIV